MITHSGYGKYGKKLGMGDPPLGWPAEIPWNPFKGVGNSGLNNISMTSIILGLLRAVNIDPDQHVQQQQQNQREDPDRGEVGGGEQAQDDEEVGPERADGELVGGGRVREEQDQDGEEVGLDRALGEVVDGVDANIGEQYVGDQVVDVVEAHLIQVEAAAELDVEKQNNLYGDVPQVEEDNNNQANKDEDDGVSVIELTAMDGSVVIDKDGENNMYKVR